MILNSWGRLITAWGSSGTGSVQFNKPRGLAVDRHMRVWVVDSGNRRVLIFSVDGELLDTFQPENESSFLEPGDIAVGSDGYFFVVDEAKNAIFHGRYR